MNSYSICNKLFFNISGNCLTTYFVKKEFENFRTSIKTKPDIKIDIQNFSPNTNRKFILDNSFFIDKTYFYCEDRYKYIKWNLEINNFSSESDIHISLSTNILGIFFIQNILIEPFLFFYFTLKGGCFLHASGVCKNDKSVLFCGQGGAGKTTLSLYLCKKGFSYLGDNYIPIFNKKAYSYLSPINFFSFNCPSYLKKVFPLNKKMEFLIKSILRKLNLSLATKVNPREVVPSSSENARINYIIQIYPKKNFYVEELDLKEFVEISINNLKLDLPYLRKYLLEYAYLYPKERPSLFWKIYKKNLEKNLKKSSIFRVEIPRNLLKARKYILSFINKLV